MEDDSTPMLPPRRPLKSASVELRVRARPKHLFRARVLIRLLALFRITAPAFLRVKQKLNHVALWLRRKRRAVGDPLAGLHDRLNRRRGSSPRPRTLAL